MTTVVAVMEHLIGAGLGAVLDAVERHLLAVVVLVVLLGVVLPAVWSRRPERRCAATAVLQAVLCTVATIAVATAATPVARAVRAFVDPARAGHVPRRAS